MAQIEIDAWKALDVLPSTANTLKSGGVIPSEAKEWFGAGLVEPKSIFEWRKSGFSPEQAGRWVSAGLEDPDDAEDWAEESFFPSEAKEWLDADFSLREAVKNRAKGLRPI